MLCSSNEHINLDIFEGILPKVFKKIFVCISLAAALFFSGILCYYGFQLVLSEMKSGQTTAALHIYEWIYGSTIPAGSLLIIIHLIEWGIKELKGERK